MHFPCIPEALFPAFDLPGKSMGRQIAFNFLGSSIENTLV